MEYKKKVDGIIYSIVFVRMVSIQIVYNRWEDIVNTWKEKHGNVKEKHQLCNSVSFWVLSLIIRRQLLLRSKITTLSARNARKPEKNISFFFHKI